MNMIERVFENVLGNDFMNWWKTTLYSEHAAVLKKWCCSIIIIFRALYKFRKKCKLVFACVGEAHTIIFSQHMVPDLFGTCKTSGNSRIPSVGAKILISIPNREGRLFPYIRYASEGERSFSDSGDNSEQCRQSPAPSTCTRTQRLSSCRKSHFRPKLHNVLFNTTHAILAFFTPL